VERPIRNNRFPLAHRRRAFGVHGTSLPTRRPTLPLEQEYTTRNGRRRGGGVRGQGQGHTHSPPGGQEIWYRVGGHYTPIACCLLPSSNQILTDLDACLYDRPEAQLLTKGDNNNADDTELYAHGQDFLVRKDIIGSVTGYIPFVGYVTILLSEYPWLKSVMIGLMGLMVVLQRE
jgi:hypothetical protein